MAERGKIDRNVYGAPYLFHLPRDNVAVTNSNVEATNRMIVLKVFELVRNSVIEYPIIGTIAIAKLIIRGRM
jgi:hypothetical protein